MRVLDGFADESQQPEALVDRGVILAAVVSQRNAVNIFHDEPRSAVFERIGIVEASDSVMVELSEDALLDGEAFAARGRKPGIAKNFDGDQIAEIVALGEIDDAHAAFAEDFLNAVGTKLFCANRSVNSVPHHLISGVGHAAIEK